MARKNTATGSPQPIIFVLRGEELPAEPGTARTATTRTREVRIAGPSRTAQAQEHRLEALPGLDVVELTLSTPDGERVTLFLGPESARDLLQAQAGAANAAASGAGGTVQAPGEVRVGSVARWAMPAGAQAAAATSRSGLGDLAFSGLRVFGLDLRGDLAKASAQAFKGWRDQQVDEGVYRVPLQLPEAFKGRAKLGQLDQVTSGAPQLVLIHGTFVDTVSTFGNWWGSHHGLVRDLFTHYNNQVYALDHATLGASPIHNALTLARTLRDGARLHLVTHSRGGLVAEALVRACAGIGAADLQFFDGAGYANHRAELQALGDLLKGRDIQVERVVRVACPAHGTHLASGRLDAYFSVLAHLLEMAGMPLTSEGVDFIREIAHRRSNPQDFPGLEAMMPERAFANWINSPLEVPGDLRVVAGDVEPSLLNAWLRALVAYALQPVFMEDNDLVVQTSSMYGGAARLAGASFLLARGNRADHLSYFLNDGTANAIARALTTPQPLGFLPIGPGSAAGLDSSGWRAAKLAREIGSTGSTPAPDGSRPAVIVLPGIMGSHLKDSGNQREWLVWWRLFGAIDRLAWRANNPMKADGAIGIYYGDLMEHLSASHDVIEMAFDWRAPLMDSAHALAQVVSKQLALRAESKQPVRLLAHSMGGVVARVMALEEPGLWAEMMARQGARLVMLGTPHGGSWAPMTLYTGDDNLGRFLVAVGGGIREKWARDRIAEFEGLLQLQATLEDDQAPLANRSYWEELAQRDAELAAKGANSWHDWAEVKFFYDWAIPSQEAINRAVDLRRRLKQQDANLGDDAQRMVIVLGSAPSTPCGLVVEGPDIAYQYTAEGDGRVTWASACLPQVATWRADCDHSDLPNAKHLFSAYEELLSKGTVSSTSQLAPYPWSPSRGSTPRIGGAAPAGSWVGRSRGLAIQMAPTQDQLLRELLGGGGDVRRAARGGFAPAAGKLSVTVQHGDVRFINAALLIGHSSALALTGSEAVVDHLLGGVLGDALHAGLYPDAAGAHQVFVNHHGDPANPWGLPKPQAVIVVGLGADSDLKPTKLRETVRQGVLAYLQRVAEQRAGAGQAAASTDAQAPISLAMTSLGSGGNLSVAESVFNAVHGVLDANARVTAPSGHQPWPQVAQLCFVEIHLERAAEAWRSLHMAINAGDLAATLHGAVTTGQGGRSRQTELNYRGVSHDLIRVTTQETVDGRDKDGTVKTHQSIEFTLFTKRARSEIRARSTQRALVDAMVAQAEQGTRLDRELGRALYQLLLPLELRPYLDGGSAVVLELDQETAKYPWEMLDDFDARPGARNADKPLGLRMGSMLRRLALREFRCNPVDSAVADILVVGMSTLPQYLNSPLAELPGVRDEVRHVRQGLNAQPVTVLLDEPSLNVVKHALSRPWKVVHFSGHGVHDPKGASGMILSNNTVFGPSEFEGMDQTPELVFINCCHLGKMGAAHLGQRNQFAANVAEQLIGMGVRCVVAAGWAVDDAAAAAFAHAFYKSLADGNDFANAVRSARDSAHGASPTGNTWAAYQCYGDAAWRLNDSTPGAASARNSATPQLATQTVLLGHLEEIEIAAQSADPRQRDALTDRLTQLLQLDAARKPWLRQGAVAEGVARCWQGLRQWDQAIAWYQSAQEAADGGASFKAREQMLNLQARSHTTQDQRLKALADLRALADISPTAERWSLIGSAYKRLTMNATSKKQREQWLREMSKAYAKAEALNPPDMFYPAGQHFLADLRLHWLDGAGYPMPDVQRLQDLRQHLLRKESQGADFWSTVAHTELDLYEAVLQHQLQGRVSSILKAFANTQGRITDPTKWGSVLDTARFVLEPYRATASKSEQGAVDALIAGLSGYSG